MLNFPHGGDLQNVMLSSYKNVLVQSVHKTHVKHEPVIVILIIII